MKKTKKSRINKSRFAIFALALILPICSSGLAYGFAPLSAEASTVAQYSTGHIEEVSLSNNNFASSSSSYSLSTSLTGWTAEYSSGSGTTAGTISTGSTFNSYMSSTFYLSSNPGTASTDNYVLMINSNSSTTNEYSEARQGYTSNDITLDANSFYSFQVSFKSDSAYSSETTYVQKGTTEGTNTISTTNFTASGFTVDSTAPVYVAATINNNTYYVEKTLKDSGTISATTASGLDILGEIEISGTTYAAFVYDDVYYFVSLSDSTYVEKSSDSLTLTNGATLYTPTAFSSTGTTNSAYSSLSVFYQGTAYVGVVLDGNNVFFAASDVSISNGTASVESGATYYQTVDTFSSVGTFTATYAQDLEVFYTTDNDTTYIGVEYADGKYGFVKIEDTTDPSNADGKIDVKVGATIYECINIEYNGTNYTIASETDYYTTTTSYTSLTQNAKGSIYLSGLVDENGDEISVNFENVSSDEWVTFYIYVATGDTEQTVNLELWLASKTSKNSGVVFFDNVHVYQYSQNMFWKDYQNNYGKSYSQTYYISGTANGTEEISQVLFQDLREESETIATIDFEDATASSLDSYFAKYWTKSTSGAKIYDTSAASTFKSETGFDYVGSNLAAYENLDNGVSFTENKYVLALWANDSTVKVTYNESFEIKANEIIKITVSYKFSGLESGSAYIYVTEDGEVLETYNLSNTPTLTDETANSGVSENGDSDFNNEYGTMEIYIKGRALYNSSFTFALGLGDDSTSATGCVIFDDIKIEYATTEEYSDSSDVVELGDSIPDPTITNGAFNNVTVSDSTTLPSADDWTIETDENETTFSGVINTYSANYSAYQDAYAEYEKDSETSGINNPYYWAKISNPGDPNSTTSAANPNNILMLYNASTTYQTLTSPTMTLSADTSYALSFKYKTNFESYGSTFSVTAYLSSDDTTIKLFEKTGMGSDTWTTMTIYFENGFGSAEVYLVIDFGTESDGVQGYAFFDNFDLTELDSSDDIPTSATTNYVDMTEFYLNLPTNTRSDDETDYFVDSTAYTYAVTAGSQNSMLGGIVSSEMFSKSDQKEMQPFALDEEQLVFFMQISGEGSCTITSNFGIDLTAETYYKLTFKVKSTFGEETDEETTYSYGLTAGLTGFDYAKQIRTDEDANGYTEYTIYFCPTEDVTTNLYFCLISDTSYGMVVIYDVQLTNGDDDSTIETAYSTAESTMEAKSYDINSDCVLVAYEDGTDADSSTDSDSSDSDDETSTEQNYEWMMYFSTIIFGVAIIVAIVGYALRHVRIKKFKKKEKIDYAREHTVDMEVIRQKARAQRDEEIAKVEETLSKFQKELDRLEAEHKENVVKLRDNDNGKLTKVTDKEFKEFGQKRTVISEKIDSLKKQIEDMKTPEYLMTIERKVFDIEEAKRKELLKMKKDVGLEDAPTQEERPKTSKKKKSESNDKDNKTE